MISAIRMFIAAVTTLVAGPAFGANDFAVPITPGVSADGLQVTLAASPSVGGATYQWYRGATGDTSSPVEGANSASLTRNRTTVSSRFWVRATSGSISGDSAAFEIARWAYVDPLFGTEKLYAGAYGEGRFVVVGTAAGSSDNGLDWTRNILPAGAVLKTAHYGGGVFVAGGDGGQVYVSDDGLSWTQRRPADADFATLLQGAFGNGVHVMVGATSKVMVSSDGVNWQWRSFGPASESINLASVIFAAGKFVAVGYNAHTSAPRAFRSADGVEWTACSLPAVSPNPSFALGSLRRVIYSGGRFLAFGVHDSFNGPHYVHSSLDGITWNPAVQSQVTVSLAAMAEADGVLLSGTFRTSGTGTTWSEPNAPQALGLLSWLTHGEGTFVAIYQGDTGGFSQIFTSTNATSWTPRVGAGVGGHAAHAGGKFVFVRPESSPRTNTGVSMDGFRWQVGTVSNSRLENVAGGNGMFVASASFGSAFKYFTSPDGAAWTGHSPSFLGEGNFSRFQNLNGQWIGVGGGGIYTSPDAVTWTNRASGGNAFRVAALSHGNGKYVGVGFLGTLFTSADAIVWNEHPAITSGHLLSMAFGAGRFVAVQGGVGGGTIWTTTDGVTWSSRSLPPRAGGYTGSASSVVYGNGTFMVAVGADILTSADGLSWQVNPAAIPISSNNQSSTLLHAAGGFWAVNAAFGLPNHWFRAPESVELPVINGSPANTLIAAGQPATFSVAATGTGLEYQWYRGQSGDTTQPVPGAGGPVLRTEALSVQTSYWVRVSSGAGFVDSSAATASIATAPLFADEPDDADLKLGMIANLEAIASGNPAPTYQWYAGSSGDTSRPISGATGAGYPVLVSDIESFWVRATNIAGSADSRTAVITPWRQHRSLGSIFSLQSVHGRLVATPHQHLLLSPDGAGWAEQPLTGPDRLGPMSHGKGMFVAGGKSTSGSFGIYTSPDLVEWTRQTVPDGFAGDDPHDSVYAMGRFIMASGNRGGFLASPDGVSWSRQSLGPENSTVTMRSVVFAKGMFVGTGSVVIAGDVFGTVLTSPDGVVWTRRDTGLAAPVDRGTEMKKVVFAGGKFIAVGPNMKVLSSDDGISWNLHRLSSPFGDYRFTAAAYHAGRYVVGTDSPYYFESADAGVWVEKSGPPGMASQAMAVHGGKLFAAGTGTVHSSVNGTDWTLEYGRPGVAISFGGVAYGSGGFVLSGSRASDFVSAHGLNWRMTSDGFGSQGAMPVRFGNGLYLSPDGDVPGKYWRSADGLDWEPAFITGSSGTFGQIEFANGIHFALGSGGSFATSVNGHDWQIRNIGVSENLDHVAYGNGMFLISARGRAYRSENLDAWVQGESTGVARMAFGHGVFVGIAANRIMTSADGATWITRLAPATATSDVDFDGARFAVAGSDGMFVSRNAVDWNALAIRNTRLLAHDNRSFLATGQETWQSLPGVSALPAVERSPSDFSAPMGHDGGFTVLASGGGLSYRWRKDGVPLSDGGRVRGSDTAMLIITDLRGSDAAQYDVVVRNLDGQTTSSPAELQVMLPDGDFDGDGIADLLLQNPASGERVIWNVSDGAVRSSIHLPTFTAGWFFAGSGDFDGDGRSDIVLENRESGEHVIWRMRGGAISGSIGLPTLPRVWRISCVGDVDGDGHADIVLHNTRTMERVVWIMAGSSISRSQNLPSVNLEWHVAGALDFSGDGRPDLVVENTRTRERLVWVLGNSLEVIRTIALPDAVAGWRIGGVGRFLADGLPGIVLQDSNTGRRRILSISVLGSVSSSVELPATGLGWTLAGPGVHAAQPPVPGDLDGDGMPDLLLENGITGERVAWLLNGAVISGSVSLPTVAAGWHFAGTGDFNGNGGNDILLQNRVTGERVIWLMAGTELVGSLALPTLPPSWQFAAVADLNADGNADIVLQAAGTDARVAWLMSGGVIAASAALPPLSEGDSIAGVLDFDGDVLPDLVVENGGSGARTIVLMDANLNLKGNLALPGFRSGWRFGAVGHYTDDGRPNIVLQNGFSGDRVIWSVDPNGAIERSTGLPQLPISWSFAGAALNRAAPPVLSDLDGDGASDILLTNVETGERVIWALEGTSISRSVGLPTLPAAWQFAGNGDFNGDGMTDILLQNGAAGERVIWLMNAGQIGASAALPTLDPIWDFGPVVDLNGDGNPDIILQNAGTGARQAWLMDRTAIVGAIDLPGIPPSWIIAAGGHFTPDGRPSLLLENTSTGDRVFWAMNADGSIHRSIGLPGFLGGWRFAGVGDFFRSGRPHIVLQNRISGDRVIWRMDGTNISASAGLPTLPLSWTIRN